MSSPKPLIGCSTYHIGTDRLPYEVYGLMASYIRAIQAGGGIPILIPHGLDEADLQAVFARIDGVVLPGGGDIHPSVYGGDVDHPRVMGVSPSRDTLELWLAREAVAQEKPVLAICRGHQVFNVAMGGTIFEDLADQMDGAIKHDYWGDWPRNHLPHEVKIAENSRLAEIIGSPITKVNSLHHQGIRDLGNGLEVTGLSPDGLIEAIEVPGHRFALGVQWHPENLIHDDPAMLRLFQGLVTASST